MICPRCGSEYIKKNGSTYSKKQKYQCNTCKYQFTKNPKNKIISDETKKLIDKLLLEKIPLAGIARVMDVSEKWLQLYINDKYEKVSKKINIIEKPKGKLTLQCDELWSFVDNKNNKQWVWLAQDVSTREIVGCYVGDRSQKSAKCLWQSLPPVYRQCAVCYTDYWEAYSCVFPKNRHKAVGKESGKTSYIERLNNTFRQRISRLVRKTLSFSKKVENHIGAIWYFIHHYNDTLRSKISPDSTTIT